MPYSPPGAEIHNDEPVVGNSWRGFHRQRSEPPPRWVHSLRDVHRWPESPQLTANWREIWHKGLEAASKSRKVVACRIHNGRAQPIS